jgi:hypothetical protein
MSPSPKRKILHPLGSVAVLPLLHPGELIYTCLDGISNVELPANVAATYLRWNEERNVSLIQLPFVLRFRDSIVPNRRKGPQSLFCVDLHFSPAGTKEFYKRAISNVSVPFLATSSTLTPTVRFMKDVLTIIFVHL